MGQPYWNVGIDNYSIYSNIISRDMGVAIPGESSPP